MSSLLCEELLSRLGAAIDRLIELDVLLLHAFNVRTVDRVMVILKNVCMPCTSCLVFCPRV